MSLALGEGETDDGVGQNERRGRDLLDEEALRAVYGEHVLGVARVVLHAGVPVIEGETDDDIEVALEHLVAADEAAHLALAVLDQTADLGGSGRASTEHHHAEVQLRTLRLLRVPAGMRGIPCFYCGSLLRLYYHYFFWCHAIIICGCMSETHSFIFRI